MGMKPLADVLQKLSRGLEIKSGAGHGGVSQISGEQRELGRQIVILLIPCQEAVHCKRVAQGCSKLRTITLACGPSRSISEPGCR